ncbi:MAG: hypothetical protein Q9162_004220 [Coniocarpon cinnabarinum]
MKLSLIFSALLATEVTVASSWFSKAVYNKWHESELERWLSDHEVPYPTPADRKDLENLVKTNWRAAVESPYLNWDTTRLQKQLQTEGLELKRSATQSKDELVNQVQAGWTDTEDKANSAYASIRDWIFDSWSDSQIKAFCDHHGINVPQPTQRDVLIKHARENYQSAANKVSETSSYPGNWLWANWSDSELKAWLDERGIKAPQAGKRDQLIASVRRNSRVASLNAQKAVESLSSSAAAATDSLSSEVFNAWSDSDIKAFLDKNGVKVPQGSKRNELLALARKNQKLLTDSASDAASSASGYVGAATSSAGNEFAKTTEDASLKSENLFDSLYQQARGYADQVQVALGLKDSYASSVSKSAASVSKSASSAYVEASKAAKSEL